MTTRRSSDPSFPQRNDTLMKEEVEEDDGSTVVLQDKVTKRSKLGH